MRVIILGAPGSGKGTQCKWISKEYDIPHISTGDIFRKNIAEETELGLKVKDIMARGDLVPDEIVVNMLKNRLDYKLLNAAIIMVIIFFRKEKIYGIFKIFKIFWFDFAFDGKSIVFI